MPAVLYYSIKWRNSNFARTVWRFWLPAWKYDSVFKEFATDDSNTNFEQRRVALFVSRFSDHKCRHGNVYAARCNVTRKKTVWVIINRNYVPAGYNRCLVYNRFYCLSHRTSQYGKELNISVSRLRRSANHNALDNWPIRTRLVLRTMSFVKMGTFQKGGA